MAVYLNDVTMIEKDSLQQFMFEKAAIRGGIARLNETFTTIINQRNYPPVVRQLLGEALLSCLLLTASIKFEGELSLQFQGNQHLSLLLVQCDHHLNMRGFANFEEHWPEPLYTEAFLNGQMALTIQQNNSTQSYQSVVPIQSVSMAENLMHYFAQSEQLATRIWLATDNDCAAGMLIQLMPGQDTLQREQFWEYAVVLGETVSSDELLRVDNATLLHRLYHETELRLFDGRSVAFKCRCSRAKMVHVLNVLGEKDIKQLLAEKGQVEVSCEFCNSHYAFDAVDVELLFHNPR